MATLKNTVINDTGALFIPAGTTAQRPGTPVDGDTRYNTDRGYIEYFWKGFWVDARTNYGGIVWDGCVVCLDIGNPASYPGSGSTITNLGSGGSGYNGTINGTPNYLATFGGHLYGTASATAGTSQHISVPIDWRTQNFTVITATRYNGANRGRILSCSGNNWLLGHHSDYNQDFYAEGWIVDTRNSTLGDNGVTRGDWAIHCGTGHITDDRYEYYRNGELHTRNNGGSAGPYNFVVGYYGLGGLGSQASDWSFSILLAYNRVLTAEEIKQTSLAIRARNGI